MADGKEILGFPLLRRNILLRADLITLFRSGTILIEDMVGEGDFLKSEYYSRSKRSVSRAVGEKGKGRLPELEGKDVPRVIEISDEIHRQGGENLTLWNSKILAGVSAVHTRVSALEAVANLAEKWGNAELAAKAKLAMTNSGETERRVNVVFSSNPGTFKTDGSPYTPWDIVEERVGVAMSEVCGALQRGKPIDIEVLSVGNPLSEGGKVTNEFIEKMQNDGVWETQSVVDAEVIHEELTKSNSKVVVQGQSWGGAQAVEALDRHEKTYGENPNLRGLVDDPTPLWGGNRLLAGAVQTGLGEMLNRYDDFTAKLWFPGKFEKFLAKRGIPLNDTKEQAALKKIGFELGKKVLSTGPKKGEGGEVFPRKTRVHVRQAIGDVTLNPEVAANAKAAVHVPGVEDHTDLHNRDGKHAFDRYKETAERRKGVLVKKIEGKYNWTEVDEK